MSDQSWDIETRLRQALAPVDPPADLETARRILAKG